MGRYGNAGLTVWQKRHMPRARAFWSSALTVFYFFPNFFGFMLQCEIQTVRQCGALKSPSPPENARAPKFKKRGPIKLGPNVFLFPVSVFQRGAPKSPRSSVRKRQAPKFKNRGPNSRVETVFLFPVSAQDPNSAGPQRVQGP